MLCLFICTSAHSATDITSAQHGRHIYHQGEKITGESITANVGAASIPVPATALPCVGCHGRDGTGRPEGGVIPSNISWSNLAKEYGGTTAIGRRYGAYDEADFLRAVTEGIDSSGNKLDTSMPRYNISRQDARDLATYLKEIADDYDPGVSQDEIVFGTLQPAQEVQGNAARAMVSVVRTYLNEINTNGGIYGRNLRLEVLHYDDRQSFIGQANKLITDDQVFALVCSFSASADQYLTDMVEEGEVPSIVPYTQFPTAEGDRHRYTFYLHGGLETQIAALAKRAGKKAEKTDRVYVLYNQDVNYKTSAQKAMVYLKENNIENPQLVAYTLNAEKQLSEFIDLNDGTRSSILFLGSSQDLVQLLGSGFEKPQLPDIFLPGFFVSRHILNLPTAYAGKMEMAYSMVPDGNDGTELSDFRQFMIRNKLEHNYLAVRLFAYSAVRTLVEGVKRSGKRISRDKLVNSVEELYGHDIGLNNLISYGSRRRTGLLGAYIVKLDTEKSRLHPTGTWVKLD